MGEMIKRRILNISLPVTLYKDLEEMAREKAKTKAEFAREAITRYIESEKRWQYIRKWGQESARQHQLKDENDIEEIIHSMRKEGRND
ncbi:hypothetical protein [Moorella sp. ACPs]|uniref:hypothetical protein n=1 Tax=Neomoorella carbonis TaxID=3062783 RepID=UPI0032476EDC